MKKLFSIIFIAFICSGTLVQFAAAELPPWAKGQNLQTQVQDTGESLYNMGSAILGVVGILAMITGAILIAANNDLGKKVFVGGALGLLLGGLIFGIAALFG